MAFLSLLHLHQQLQRNTLSILYIIRVIYLIYHFTKYKEELLQNGSQCNILKASNGLLTTAQNMIVKFRSEFDNGKLLQDPLVFTRANNPDIFQERTQLIGRITFNGKIVLLLLTLYC
jgi:hypothetical protein